MLTTEFLAGYISANGSFMNVNVRDKQYPVFQIKTSLSNYALLLKIAHSVGATNVVHKYTNGKQHFCILLIRNRETIINRLIPLLDGILEGNKLHEFNEWKEVILKNSSTWNTRVHKNTANSYRIIEDISSLSG
jgi:hypothetical protein